MTLRVSSSGIYNDKVPYVKERLLDNLGLKLWDGDYEAVDHVLGMPERTPGVPVDPHKWIRVISDNKEIVVHTVLSGRQPTTELRVTFFVCGERTLRLESHSVVSVGECLVDTAKRIHQPYLRPEVVTIKRPTQTFTYKGVEYRVVQSVMELETDTIDDRYRDIISHLTTGEESPETRRNLRGTDFIVIREKDTHYPRREVSIRPLQSVPAGTTGTIMDAFVVPKLRDAE